MWGEKCQFPAHFSSQPVVNFRHCAAVKKERGFTGAIIRFPSGRISKGGGKGYQHIKLDRNFYPLIIRPRVNTSPRSGAVQGDLQETVRTYCTYTGVCMTKMFDMSIQPV
jgi:hypothetical protein